MTDLNLQPYVEPKAVRVAGECLRWIIYGHFVAAAFLMTVAIMRGSG